MEKKHDYKQIELNESGVKKEKKEKIETQSVDTARVQIFPL